MPDSKHPANSSELSSPEDRAIRILSHQYFHRALWLPETADHPKLRVTYSTTTNFDDASVPAILFIGPMFGSRWSAPYYDKLASDSGVRLICTDRPGMGGSTPVHINIRMKVWLETVPTLLQKLDIKHVNFMTHSAGAMYTLNSLLHHRTFLDPKTPTVTFLAPYVPLTESGATLPTLLSKLPVNMIDQWANLNVFINNKIMPTASWSSGLLSNVPSLFSSSASTDTLGAEVSASTTLAERYGVDDEVGKEIDNLSTKYKLAEDTHGVNEEAKLCLRKCEDTAWGEAQGYAECIRTIAQNERTWQQQDPGRTKLKVEACFSGSDIMIGKGGQEYFEQCWQHDGFKESLDFVSKTFPEANHDSLIMDYKKGALRDVFEKVARSGGIV